MGIHKYIGSPYIVTVTDYPVPAQRNFNVIYQNTTGKNLFVNVTVSCWVTVVGGYAGGLLQLLDSNVESTGGWDVTASLDNRINAALLIIVPPGGRYRLLSDTLNGAVQLHSWYESN
jgi:hypothetical protein